MDLIKQTQIVFQGIKLVIFSTTTPLKSIKLNIFWTGCGTSLQMRM